MGNNLTASYDLFKPGQNYEVLIEQIKLLGNWAHVHESVWYVNSDCGAAQARDRLLPYLDANDSLFIVDATNNDAARYNLKPQVAKFIKENWCMRLAA